MTDTNTDTEAREFDVLHTVRVRGLASAAAISEATGLSADETQSVLDGIVEQGLAKLRTGRVEGYMLTAAGRERHLALRAQRVSGADEAALAPAYEAFLAPNQAFKQVTTDSQTDPTADQAVVLERLEPIHEQVGTVLSLASAAVPRMAGYQPRFDRALAAYRSGDRSALAKPMSGSYHDVWMELHEDLVLTLGRERTDADG